MYVKDFQFFKWFGKTEKLLSPILCTLPGLTTFTGYATPHSCKSVQGALKHAKFHYHGWKVTLTRTESLYLCTHVSSADKHCKYWTCCCLGTKASLCPASGHGPKPAFKGPPAPNCAPNDTKGNFLTKLMRIPWPTPVPSVPSVIHHSNKVENSFMHKNKWICNTDIHNTGVQ